MPPVIVGGWQFCDSRRCDHETPLPRWERQRDLATKEPSRSGEGDRAARYHLLEPAGAHAAAVLFVDFPQHHPELDTRIVQRATATQRPTV